jgi:hydrogenase nickel incorporation protein HypA/HybF
MYFNEISKGTLCEGCGLKIKRVKPTLECNECNNIFEMEPFSFKCPVCGSDAHITETGNEFFIEYIEVEQKE